MHNPDLLPFLQNRQPCERGTQKTIEECYATASTECALLRHLFNHEGKRLRCPQTRLARVQPHSPGHKPYRSRPERLTLRRLPGGDQREVSNFQLALGRAAFRKALFQG